MRNKTVLLGALSLVGVAVAGASFAMWFDLSALPDPSPFEAYVATKARRWLRQLEEENRRLKHLVADLTLDKQTLQELVRKKF